MNRWRQISAVKLIHCPYQWRCGISNLMNHLSHKYLACQPVCCQNIYLVSFHLNGIWQNFRYFLAIIQSDPTVCWFRMQQRICSIHYSQWKEDTLDDPDCFYFDIAAVHVELRKGGLPPNAHHVLSVNMLLFLSNAWGLCYGTFTCVKDDSLMQYWYVRFQWDDFLASLISSGGGHSHIPSSKIFLFIEFFSHEVPVIKK